GWKWLLKNGLLDMMAGALLNKSALVRVRFASEYLWRSGGVERAVRQIEAFLTEMFKQPLLLQPAEIHVCADMVSLQVPRDYEQVFVSRAKLERPVRESHLDKPVYRYHRLETVQFSGHGSPISATIYDKPREIQIKSRSKTWFYDLWK